MKGVIAICLAELVKTKFGEEKWNTILQESGIPVSQVFLHGSDIDDAVIMKVLGNTCKVLGINLEQAADAFGDYWVNEFAPKIYGVYYNKYQTAKEFIIGLEDIHRNMTKSMTNAHPPRFEFKEVDDKTIIVTYKSHRNLIQIYIGLAKGISKYFNTPIAIKKLSESQVELTFN